MVGMLFSFSIISCNSRDGEQRQEKEIPLWVTEDNSYAAYLAHYDQLEDKFQNYQNKIFIPFKGVTAIRQLESDTVYQVHGKFLVDTYMGTLEFPYVAYVIQRGPNEFQTDSMYFEGEKSLMEQFDN